jgi:hypothetical protein
MRARSAKAGSRQQPWPQDSHRGGKPPRPPKCKHTPMVRSKSTHLSPVPRSSKKFMPHTLTRTHVRSKVSSPQISSRPAKAQCFQAMRTKTWRDIAHEATTDHLLDRAMIAHTQKAPTRLGELTERPRTGSDQDSPRRPSHVRQASKQVASRTARSRSSNKNLVDSNDRRMIAHTRNNMNTIGLMENRGYKG